MSEQQEPTPAEPEILPEGLPPQEGYKYNWSVLADGQARKLIRGVHFDCLAESFKVSAYLHARKRRWPTPRVEISDDGKEVLLQFRKRKPRTRKKSFKHERSGGAIEVEIKQSANDNVTIRIRSVKS